jgi:hypothetical protein
LGDGHLADCYMHHYVHLKLLYYFQLCDSDFLCTSKRDDDVASKEMASYLTPLQWIGSVAERINTTMHYQV